MVLLFVVSCDKNELGEDVSSINAIEAPVDGEINVEVIDIINTILGLDVSHLPKKQVSLTGKGSDRLTMQIFTSDGVTYSTYLSEDNDDLCFGDVSVLTTVHLNKSTTGSIEVTIGESESVFSTVSGNFDTLFTLSINQLLKITADGTESADFNENNVATF